MKPAVTVLIDTYNHERFIEEAIVSVLEQDFPPSEMEIIVVDDGSTDRTPEIIRKFAPRVSHLRKANGGQASAFNAGIPEAQGELIAFLDGDDWWARNKVSRAMQAFHQEPELGIVGHGIVMVDEAAGRRTALSPPSSCHFSLRDREHAQAFRNYMCFLGTSRVVIRSSIARKALPIPEHMVVEADEFLSAVSASIGEGFVLDDCLTFYRLHANNLYQFRGQDPARIRRKLNSIACLAESLPVRLAETGVGPEEIGIVVNPIRIEATRLRLAFNGGFPWSAYSVEKEAMRLSYLASPATYRLYKELSLLLALALPPRRYYQLREWYAAKGLRRFRRVFGEPKPVAQFLERPWMAGPTDKANVSLGNLSGL